MKIIELVHATDPRYLIAPAALPARITLHDLETRRYGKLLVAKVGDVVAKYISAGDGWNISVPPDPEWMWLCPFCKEPCEVGFDCECGAKAMNSMTWLEPTKPLMRGPGTDHLDAFCLGWNKAHGTASLEETKGAIREMISPSAPSV